jgi:hypothetical protein
MRPAGQAAARRQKGSSLLAAAYPAGLEMGSVSITDG